jgi:hypothetical protein
MRWKRLQFLTFERIQLCSSLLPYFWEKGARKMRTTGFMLRCLFFLLLLNPCISAKSKIISVDGKRYNINDHITLQAEFIHPSTSPTIKSELSNQFRKRNLQTSEERNKMLDEITEQFLVKLEDDKDVYKTREMVEKIVAKDSPSQHGNLLVYIPHQSYAFLAKYRTALKVAALQGVCVFVLCIIPFDKVVRLLGLGCTNPHTNFHHH